MSFKANEESEDGEECHQADILRENDRGFVSYLVSCPGLASGEVASRLLFVGSCTSYSVSCIRLY